MQSLTPNSFRVVLGSTSSLITCPTFLFPWSRVKGARRQSSQCSHFRKKTDLTRRHLKISDDLSAFYAIYFGVRKQLAGLACAGTGYILTFFFFFLHADVFIKFAEITNWSLLVVNRSKR